ncbi:MAG: ParB N-terminal domain-containing protein [Mycoplasma sp.]|nr:ParB N-terminal domain-containing protein [Mycoplasma sp.]
MNHIESNKRIYESKEPLELFKHNREIKEKMLNSLVKSMEEEGFRSTEPIIIGKHKDKWIIIDGQHRYEAQQVLHKAGRDINYLYVIEDLEDMTDEEIGKRIVAYNTQKKTWTTEDYLRLYCGLGYNEYIKLNKIVEAYGSLTLTLKLFKIADEHNTHEIYKKGYFKYTEEKESTIIDIMCLVSEIKKRKSAWINFYMVPALFKFFSGKKRYINKEVFMDNLYRLNAIDGEEKLVNELDRLFQA